MNFFLLNLLVLSLCVACYSRIIYTVNLRNIKEPDEFTFAETVFHPFNFTKKRQDNLPRSTHERGVNGHVERSQSNKYLSQKKRSPQTNSEEIPWHHCADESRPVEIDWGRSPKGVMCSKEYPTFTCCSQDDLTVDLLGSKIVDQIPNIRCSKMLKKLQCAHCSPRSWGLFHAPDIRRPPHKRIVPILCPSFCRKFHSACRDYVSGLQYDDFCDFHTSNERGVCFPDYKLKRGTID